MVIFKNFITHIQYVDIASANLLAIFLMIFNFNFICLKKIVVQFNNVKVIWKTVLICSKTNTHDWNRYMCLTAKCTSLTRFIFIWDVFLLKDATLCDRYFSFSLIFVKIAFWLLIYQKILFWISKFYLKFRKFDLNLIMLLI